MGDSGEWSLSALFDEAMQHLDLREQQQSVDQLKNILATIGTRASEPQGWSPAEAEGIAALTSDAIDLLFSIPRLDGHELQFLLAVRRIMKHDDRLGEANLQHLMNQALKKGDSANAERIARALAHLRRASEAND